VIGIERIEVLGQLGQIVHETPIFKITRAKWTGGVVQAVEHLCCKHKALSSNPVPPKKPQTNQNKTKMFCYSPFTTKKLSHSVAK
jgi:hypothetical protein